MLSSPLIQAESLSLADKPTPQGTLTNPLGFEAIVGHNLRIRRLSLGVSQGQSARSMNLSLASYKRLEAGNGQVRLYSAVLWSLRHGVPTSWLLNGTGFALPDEPVMDPAWQPLISFLSLARPEVLQCFVNLLPHILDQAHCPSLKAVNIGDIPSLPSETDYYAQLSNHLRQWRESQRLSQPQAAERLDVSENTYRRYECPNRTNRFNLNLMLRFHKAARIDPLELSVNTKLYDYRKRQRAMLTTVLSCLAGYSNNERDSLLASIQFLTQHLRYFRDN